MEEAQQTSFYTCSTVTECFEHLRKRNNKIAFLRVEEQHGPIDDRFMKRYDAWFDFENVERIVAHTTTILDPCVFTRDCPLKTSNSNYERYDVVLRDPSKPFRAVAIMAVDRALSLPYPEGYRMVNGILVGPAENPDGHNQYGCLLC